MKSQTKKNSYKYCNIIYLLIFFPLLIGCEDLFLRFKYETYECTKNYFKLKSVFIKNYDPGDLVDVEIDNSGYKLKIKENNESLMIIEREDPFISIRIEKNPLITRIFLILRPSGCGERIKMVIFNLLSIPSNGEMLLLKEIVCTTLGQCFMTLRV